MTKKDYQLIASVIRDLSFTENADKETLKMLVNGLITKLSLDNSKFSGRIFENACNIFTEI